jgi:hypothetical protein
MIHISNIAEILELEVLVNWGRMKIPAGELICWNGNDPVLIDSSEVVDWLVERKFDVIYNDSEFEVLMPFFYFTKVASVYYIGGYLLAVTRILKDSVRDFRYSFGCNHAVEFVASERFCSVWPLFSEGQKRVILAIMEVVLILKDEVGISSSTVDGLTSVVVSL